MSYSGSTYDPFKGYVDHPNPAVPRPNETYDPSSYPTYLPDAGGSAYGYQSGAIPGLGMGLASSGSGQYQQNMASSSYGGPADGLTGPSVDTSGATRIPNQAPKIAEEDDMDEGEIDEGGLDDVYEPSWPQVSSTGELAASAGQTGSPNKHANAGSRSNLNSEEREHRSYSPFLSPQEVPAEEGELTDNSGVSLASSKASAGEPAPQSPFQVQQHQPPPTKTLADARKQAQDAILRLWPLNVRFQDYVNAGIDETVLQDLFLGLGFDVESTSVPTTDAAVPRAQELRNKYSVPSSTSTNITSMDSKKDTAETRKDRIARRLAAKGTDQSAPSPELPKSTSKPQAPPTGKINLDKSKLLQQKMEALRKAREAKLSISGEGGLTGAGVATPQQMPEPSQVGNPALQMDATPSQAQETDAQSAPIIPGLSFSSDARPSSAAPFKRPVASDLNDLSEVPFKRPFGQSRQPQKFLIDVSDDEDDAAMDLDSPELRPASVNKTSSPFKIPSFPDTQTGFMNRQMSSPVATPPVPAPGDEDLEAKEKHIAELKRKIAQREAEMKAKASRPASPSVGGIVVPARASSVTSGSAVQTPDANATPLPVAPLKATPAAALGAGSQKLPKHSELRQSERPRLGRSRSRAASERLITESQAKRREKELKLQLMKSQIKRMEKEIQESLDAEERIKAEAEEESEAEEEEEAVNLKDGQAASSPLFIQQGGPPPAPAPIPSAEDSTPAPDKDPTVGPIEEEDLESDAAAAIDPAEEALGIIDEPTKQSESIHPSEETRISERVQQDVRSQDDTLAQIEQPSVEESDSSESESSDDEDDEARPDYEKPQETPAAEEDPSSSIDTSEEEEVEEEGASVPAPPGDASAAEGEVQVESSDSEMEDVATTSPITQPISTGQAESKPPSPREVANNPEDNGNVLYKLRTLRVPPENVPNEIDPKLPLCPDELAGAQCPRGAGCIYQHLDKIQAPDDQILMQLGGYGNFEGEHKQEFNNGLRQILSDARTNKIKDFDTLAKSIIDYRASFRKDPYKVLPLGDVKL